MGGLIPMARKSRPEYLEELRSSGRAKDVVLSDIAESLSELEECTKRLSSAVLGDEEAGHTGLVEKCKEHHKRIKKLERMVLWGTGAIAATALIWENFKAKLTLH